MAKPSTEDTRRPRLLWHCWSCAHLHLQRRCRCLQSTHGQLLSELAEPRRRPEKALLAVVPEAYVEGVSSRKVDDLLVALGLTGIDKSAVSRAFKSLDDVIEPFRTRPLAGGAPPYLWLGVLYQKMLQDHKIVSQAPVIAIAVRETGEREVLGWAHRRQ